MYRRSSPNRALHLPYEFDGHTLDRFQQDALVHILQSSSTLVCAPTGTGKTLIADFLVDRCLEAGERAVYTGPVKALVGQKFRDFSRRFRAERVGMVTGDITHQPDAPIVVMTTEILRNMLLHQSDRVAQIAWAIFDEIHYLGHADRGTVWEEAIMLLPSGVRILGLSATVPNGDEIASWLEHVRDEPVGLVESDERAVPLSRVYFNRSTGGVERNRLIEAFAEQTNQGAEGFDAKGGGSDPVGLWASGGSQARVRDETQHLDVIGHLARNRLFPALYFEFSRRDVAQKAHELAQSSTLLPPREREAIRVTIKRTLEEFELERDEVPGLEESERLWARGIGVHHAGLVSSVRRMCERLLERRILRVVYATETFAVGVNLPVRSVCFGSLEKWDGERFRSLTHQEYFQMAGRAGRRGLDRSGVAISVVPFNRMLRAAPPDWNVAELEPIISRIQLGYNTVANLIRRFSRGELTAFFAKSLAPHQSKAGRDDAVAALLDSFDRKRDVLRRLGHLDGERLTAKGELLASLFGCNELVAAELIDGGVLDAYSAPKLAGLCGSLVEGETGWLERSGREARGAGASRRDSGRRRRRRRGNRPRETGISEVGSMLVAAWSADLTFARERIHRQAGLELVAEEGDAIARGVATSKWCSGESLLEVAEATGADPGDVVSLCRQCMDLLRQIAHAVGPDREMTGRIHEALQRMDRHAVRMVPR